MIIEQLTLYSSNIKQQLDFYSQVFQLPIIHRAGTAISFKTGNSTLSFEYKAVATPYHFALNIPSNKAMEALDWLRARVGILGYNGQELIDFKNWNAESVYFYDADKNIVELIARKNLQVTEQKPFGPNQVLGISEIGIATDNIERVYRQLNGLHPLSIYDGNFDRFCAAGDEQGLFILADIHKKQWFPTGDIIHVSDFILRGDYNMAYKVGEVVVIN